MSGDIPDNDQVFVEILQKSFVWGAVCLFLFHLMVRLTILRFCRDFPSSKYLGLILLSFQSWDNFADFIAIGYYGNYIPVNIAKNALNQGFPTLVTLRLVNIKNSRIAGWEILRDEIRSLKAVKVGHPCFKQTLNRVVSFGTNLWCPFTSTYFCGQ